MTKKGRLREKRTLLYPQDKFSPDSFLHFVFSDKYVRDWQKLKLNDDDQRALEVMIMANPTHAPIVPGTGGMRKGRFSAEHWDKGKRSGIRVCYCYFQDHGIVYLVTAYGKTKKDNLTTQDKSAIQELIAEIEKYLDTREES